MNNTPREEEQEQERRDYDIIQIKKSHVALVPNYLALHTTKLGE